MDNTKLFEARRIRRDLPWSVIASSAAWWPVVDLFARWVREPLTERSGYTPEELDEYERLHGLQIPMPQREWWRLAGKHPFVASPIDCASFALPTDRRVGPIDGLIVVTYEDVLAGAYTGILCDNQHEIDPATHGRNEAYDRNAPFISTTLTVPELVLVTLLWTLTLMDCGELNRQTVVPVLMPQDSFVAYPAASAARPTFASKTGTCDRKLNLQAIADQFGMKHYHHPILFGDLYASDDIIRGFVGYAFRTVAAYEQFRSLVEATGATCTGVCTADPNLKLYEDGDVYLDRASGKRWRYVEINREEIQMPELRLRKRTIPARTVVRSQFVLEQTKVGE